MAGNCPDINPQDETNLILSLLPAIPSLDQLAALMFSKIDEIKGKYMIKLSELIARLLETCPPLPEIDRIINIRNNIVTQLNKIYKKIERISDAVLKAQKALNVILTAMKVAGGIITASILVQLFTPFLPSPVLAKLTAATSGAQEVIDKIKSTTEGAQRLIPIIQAVTAISIATQLLSNILRNIICKLDALDASLLECSIESGLDDGVSLISTTDNGNGTTTFLYSDFTSITTGELLPLSPELISFAEASESSTAEVDQSSTYRGFIFEIEEVPFSSTVKRIRANALNSDGIVLLQSELSFTTTPNILIEELKLIIDRDNLRAD